MTFQNITKWNYRIIEHEIEEEKLYQIHEVYYDEEGPHSWTVEPVTPTAGDQHDMIVILEGMLADAKTYPMLRIEGDGLVEIDS